MYFPVHSRKEGREMNTKSNCPVTGWGFCWKNPVHVVLFLAVLPFALNGLSTVWNAVQSAFCAMTK
jgi:hypothetical protein